MRQFLKFGVVGASGFIVNLILFTLLQRVVPEHQHALQYNIIYSISFMAGGFSNYYFNRVWTFRSTGHAVREGAQFLTVSLIALLVGLIVSAFVGKYLGHGHRTWFIGNVCGIVVNFFINKYLTLNHVR